MSYQKILITLDGSKLAEQAVKQAIKIAAIGAEIHLLSVTAPDPTSEVADMVTAVGQPFKTGENQWPPLHQPANPRAVDARKRHLKEVADWLESAEYKVTYEARPAESVVKGILDVARRGFEVIVIATHSRTGTSRAVLGSVTQAVLEKAPCPVLVVSPLTTVKS
jgi:nucleotide-binding universal stress UspA family protein